MKKLFFTISIAFLVVHTVFATNIQIDNIVIVERNDADQYIIVQFDLSWDNSFRVDDGSNTNWDAAWVFMKFKKTSETNVQWGHATLHSDGHDIPGNFTGDLGATGGVNKGIFVYPSVIFSGTATLSSMQLRWDYGEDGLLSTDEVDIRVLGVEMVYVPQGNFYVGSGGEETNTFHAGGEAVTVPYQISDASFQMDNSSGNLWASGAVVSGSFASGFPTGYDAFYMMKHGITQQAYVDFLNTLTFAQQDNRIDGSPADAVGTYPHNANRHKIKIATQGVDENSPAIYETENPYVACNFISADDLLAYLDWAALRPYTELEFEKAARGPANPVADEYVWGNTRIGKVTEISNPGASNETSVPSSYQRDITINQSKVDEDLTDFPILVKLDDTNFDFSKCRPDGFDIRFYDASGAELSYQRERHDQGNEKAEYWVKVPTVSSSQNTVITMEYGNLTASDGADAANVWDANFISLWHLEEEGEGTAGEYTDDQGSNDGQGTGAYATRVDDQLGLGQLFASNAAISVPDDATLGIENAITVSAWVKPQTLSGITLAESVADDWNDNYSMTNITVNGDVLEVTDYLNDATRIATPISLDAIKKVGSSSISWTAENGYKVMAFTSDGYFSVPEGVTEVDVLVVAGGGGGGGSPLGGGGGAGGVVYETDYSVTPGQNITVTVGAGGSGPVGPTASPWDQSNTALCGGNGGNSVFGTITAIGGGGGGRYQGLDGIDGGSGGGGAYQNASGGSALQPGSASGGFGNDGGTHSGSDYGNPGGGGAGAAGENSGATGGAGGVGLYYGDKFGDTYGENGFFAGGGGGSLYNGVGGGAGGNGGGGDGGDNSSEAQNALPNTGGGGGGTERYAGGANPGKAGDGGSGVVLVRYKDPQSVKVYTAINEDAGTPPAFTNMQVFTADGTFTVPEGVTVVDVLIVAGGGGGGGSAGGGASGAGGGGGGVIYAQNISVTNPTYNIVVGAGGGSPAAGNDVQGTNGGNSTAFSLTAIGGGGGGSRNPGDATGKDGGSGGGAGSQLAGVQGNGTQPGSADGGYGSNGGDSGYGGNTGDDNASGGGGGAGGVGGNGQDNVRSGNGGIGVYYGDIFGESVGDDGWFGGGGGGGNPGGNRIAGTGGKGGGADGGDDDAVDATANTGGGGGGAGADGAPSDGGSGIVIVRWGHATNGGEIPLISEGDDLTGKYLWVKQELITNNSVSTPQLQSFNLEIKGEAIVAGKGEDAYQLAIYDGTMKGFINNQEISSSITNDAYQHIALSFDGSNQRIYVNGLLTGTSALAGTINTNATNLLMGTNMTGGIDEVRISDARRSQAWLKAEYHSGAGDLVNVGGEGTYNNAVYGNETFGGEGPGPLRVGFGATSSSSRTAAGASYWGIFELSGNLWERFITVGNATGLSFTGLHGDGLLDATGLFNATNWNNGAIGLRGGAFMHTGVQIEWLKISNREHAATIQNTGINNRGGRGVRTAP